MTKYNYACSEDKRLLVQSLCYISWLVFGQKNQDIIEAFMQFFEQQVQEVNIFPQGTITKKINNATPGICRKDEQSQKLIIEMLGYKNAQPSQYAFLKHEGAHECCHAFADLLPLLFSKYLQGVTKEGIHCQNHMGMIKEADPITGALINQHFYGKMYNETMMDIITAIGINAFEVPARQSADDILKKGYASWDVAKTSYLIFTSITRLTIAAFSNNGFVNYADIIKSGRGIFDINTKLKDGTICKVNDFMYGILFDQFHIEEEFDRFMGQGSYRIFSEYLDRLFMSCLSTQQIDSKEIKMIMNILPDFLNRKCQYYLKNNLLDQDSVRQIIGNFNQIWNEMQREYAAFFTQADIEKISDRARRSR
ncbi:MAG: hypothetical protein K2M17_01905 [Bacilli bacterium]|nr:hypothetical protein [Bacilli bacterium]